MFGTVKMEALKTRLEATWNSGHFATSLEAGALAFLGRLSIAPEPARSIWAVERASSRFPLHVPAPRTLGDVVFSLPDTVRGEDLQCHFI